MPNILFRADAEKSIGVGDLMSLVYLSSGFRRKGWNTFFLIRDYDPSTRIVRKYNLKNAYIFSKDLSITEEIELIKKICRDEKIDCLFMEVTKNKLTEYVNLGRPARIKACVNFDGLITDEFDIVVNWCVDNKDSLYNAYKMKKASFITGFENTILPDIFYTKSSKERDYEKKVKRILISMGGADEFNLTGSLIEALKKVESKFEFRVIIGPGYPHRRSLDNSTRDKANFGVKEEVRDMLGEYLWADLAFSTGGLTSSELVAAKTPAILISAYEHQKKRCEYYQNKGWASYIGYKDDITDKNLIKALEKMITDIDNVRKNLSRSTFRGGNEKIFESISSCR